MGKSIADNPSELTSIWSPGIGRREFLLLSSSALAGLAVTSLHAQGVRSISNAPQSHLSVGYLDYLPDASSQFPAHPAIVEAASLASGDPRFAREAHVKLIGFWRPRSSRAALAVTLLTYYPAAAEHDKLPFVTWTYRSDTNGMLATPHAEVQVPVDVEGLTLALITNVPAPIAPKEFHTTLRRVVSGKVSEVLPARADLIARGAAITLGNANTGPKLRAGTYFIALLEASSNKIGWNAMRVADLRVPASIDPRGDGPLSLARTQIPVDFPYLALAIDAGSRQSQRVKGHATVK